MLLPNNYTTLVKENGKTYLLDDDNLRMKVRQINDYQVAISVVYAFLRDNGYPVTSDWIFAIGARGADGLRSCILEETEHQIEKMEVPQFVARTWRDGAIRQVSRDIWDEADEVSRNLSVSADGIPVQESDLTFTSDGVKVDTDAITARIRPAFLMEITPDRKKEATSIKKVCDCIRQLEFSGLNALELVDKFVRAGDTPGEDDLLRAIVNRRHRPGCITPVDITAYLMLAKNNQPSNT